MATIGVMSEETAALGLWSSLLLELGHTANTQTINAIIATPALFNAMDLVICVNYRTDDVTGNALATILNTYMATNGIPLLLGSPMTNSPGFDVGVGELDTVAARLGLLGSEINRGVPDVLQEVLPNANTPLWPATNSMEFVNPIPPSLLDDPELDTSAHGTGIPGFSGSSNMYWNRWGMSSAALNLSVVPYTTQAVAGATVLTLGGVSGSIPEDNDLLPMAVYAPSGVNRLTGTAFSATFPENICWCGYLNWSAGTVSTTFGRQARSFLTGAISALIGNHANSYPASGTANLYGLDGRTLGNYVSSSVNWTAITGGGTVVLVEGSNNGTTWATITNGGPFVPTPGGGSDLTETYFFVRFTLTTPNSAISPAAENFELKITGSLGVLTATSEYFDEGLIVWLTGANEGLRSEIKHFSTGPAALSALVSVVFLNGTPDRITRTTGSWLTDGWRAGMNAVITGTVSNNATRLIAGVTATTLTLATVTTITNETDASCTLTSSETAMLELHLPSRYTVVAGDEFYLLPGCGKSLEDCRDKYDNLINIVAEPFVPGRNKIFTAPDAK